MSLQCSDLAIKINGVDTTVAAFLHAWISDVSEYVGQAIVYSRLNGVTPPTPQSVATSQSPAK